jgi:altronate hydrolase
VAALRAIQLDPRDNVLVALTDLPEGDEVLHSGTSYKLREAIAAGHNFAMQDLPMGAAIVSHGVVVGRALSAIGHGEQLTAAKVAQDAPGFHAKSNSTAWTPPDVTRWLGRTFNGYHRKDGQVGTRNYWLVIPLVFCENRNVDALREAFEDELGYGKPKQYRKKVRELLRKYRDAVPDTPVPGKESAESAVRIFPNIDGIRFLSHQGGCGGTRDDSRALCGLLAGYIHNPNVAGATVLSLGCQNAQIGDLLDELKQRDPAMAKPVLIYDQQRSGLESDMLSQAIRETFAELAKANAIERQPAPLSKLTVGLKCGGSDSFSGISANPAIGHVSDILAALGGTSLLSEFPELSGVEQALIDRCVDDTVANRFIDLMKTYTARAVAVRSSVAMNPSSGNNGDALLTDAMKSAGAARKSGTSPVNDVLDYPQYVKKPGLSLQCTPDNDVESVTAQVGAGANVILFTTGAGNPTGNPIAPVIKLASNTVLAQRMDDVIDIDTGSILDGSSSVEAMADSILESMMEVASGNRQTKAEILRQDDFIPWKRGVSL